MEKAGLTRDHLWTIVEIVPSATQTMVEMQSQGFACIKA
jgi:intracellular sulfur oxidation DsrE/DsrF family protein